MPAIDRSLLQRFSIEFLLIAITSYLLWLVKVERNNTIARRFETLCSTSELEAKADLS